MAAKGFEWRIKRRQAEIDRGGDSAAGENSVLMSGSAQTILEFRAAIRRVKMSRSEETG